MNPEAFEKLVIRGGGQIATICNLAWETGLMRGFSGNASLLLTPERILITATGAAKGRLNKNDFIVLNRSGQIVSGVRKPSLELKLHLEIYDTFPHCRAILHTHPVWMQAMAEILKGPEFSSRLINLGLAESDYWRERLVIASENPPGSQGAASSAVLALLSRWPEKNTLLLPCAIWLTGHGLCCLGEDLDSTLGISEQLEHLAHVQWAVEACRV